MCKTPTSQPVPSEKKIETKEVDRDSKIAAYAEATEIANQSNPEGPAKEAVSESNSVVRSLAGPAREIDRKEAFSLVEKALSGQLDQAREMGAKARNEAIGLRSELDALKKTREAERSEAAIRQQQAIDAAHRKWQTFIFFGGGALGVLLGVGCLILISNPATAISYAFLGPKLGWACIGGGLILISLGIAVNAIERAIDRHPVAFSITLGLAITLGIVAATLTYANHRTNVESGHN
jgi:hypothetical protein